MTSPVPRFLSLGRTSEPQYLRIDGVVRPDGAGGSRLCERRLGLFLIVGGLQAAYGFPIRLTPFLCGMSVRIGLITCFSPR
jgi:hypothetical protein